MEWLGHSSAWRKKKACYTQHKEKVFPVVRHVGGSARLRSALSYYLISSSFTTSALAPAHTGSPILSATGCWRVAATETSSKVAPLKSSWKPSKSDPRRRPPASLRRSLALVRAYKPLIIDRLISKPSEFDSFVARSLGISKRAYYSEFLDLATNYVLGNSLHLRDNVIEQAFPRKLLSEIKRELFDFQMRGDELSPTNATILMALVFAEELGVIQELSTARGLGVVTQYYTQVRHSSYSGDEAFSTDPSHVPRCLHWCEASCTKRVTSSQRSIPLLKHWSFGKILICARSGSNSGSSTFNWRAEIVTQLKGYVKK